MARRTQDVKRIEARRDEIAARLSVLETEVEQLRSEDLDLAIALRVIEKLAKSDQKEDESDQEQFETDEEAAAAIDATMTIGDMAVLLLQEAGASGLGSNDILQKIRERWLPSLMRTSLSPPLSRMKARGTIQLDGDRWKIAASNDPPEGETEDGSESDRE